MKKPQALPIFGDAYLADTTHLTTEEHGAYFLLMLAAWRQNDCHLNNDDRQLARIVGLSPRKWASIRSTVLAFWQLSGERIFQARLLKEWHFVRAKSEQNRKSAAKRWGDQDTDLFGNDESERICERNAPPPPPPPPLDTSYPMDRAKKAKRGSSLPDDFEPVLTAQISEIVNRWPPGRFERELAKFKDHHSAKGSVMKDWQAALRTWLRNADEWGNRNGQGNGNSRSGDGFLDASLALARGEYKPPFD